MLNERTLAKPIPIARNAQGVSTKNTKRSNVDSALGTAFELFC